MNQVAFLGGFDACVSHAKKVTLYLKKDAGSEEKITELEESEYDNPRDMEKDIAEYRRQYGSKLIIK